MPPEPELDDRKASECKIRFPGALYHTARPPSINPQHLLVTPARRVEYLRRKSDCISIWNTCAAAYRFHMPAASYQPDAANENRTNIFFPGRVLAPPAQTRCLRSSPQVPSSALAVCVVAHFSSFPRPPASLGPS